MERILTNIFLSAVQKEYNDEVILKERLLEFAFECKRWWDLLRFDKAFDFSSVSSE